jgi:hypothetical protein
VIVSPRLIRDFLPFYNGDMNRLVRDATRDQKLKELDAEECDMRSYQPVMEASEAEEVLELLRGGNSGTNSDG